MVSSPDKQIHNLSDVPTVELASFESPMFFYERLREVLEEFDSLRSGLLNLQKLGVSKQDSIEVTEDMSCTLSRRNTEPAESSTLLI